MIANIIEVYLMYNDSMAIYIYYREATTLVAIWISTEKATGSA